MKDNNKPLKAAGTLLAGAALGAAATYLANKDNRENLKKQVKTAKEKLDATVTDVKKAANNAAVKTKDYVEDTMKGGKELAGDISKKTSRATSKQN
jgi:ElaB/YqjD/DUF883 family membrane-anchored ribosome-binding protein